MDKIIMICGAGDSSNYVYNNVEKSFYISKVFIAGDEKKSEFLKKRVKRLGFWKVAGQVLFIVYSKLFLRGSADRRIKAINEEFGMNREDIPAEKVKYIDSVNSVQMQEEISKMKPDLVIINGTSIIKSHILDAADCHFLNIHVGITPKYRGVHGGYWALYNGDTDLVGVTTHFVDTGIDTGQVLDQTTVSISEKDNFLTYPHLQTGAALRNHNAVIRSILDGNIVYETPLSDESRIWTHPTLLQYAYGRVFKKVK
ncbi:formyl transferase [Salinicoccus sp. Marseille-QA3877]